MSPSPNPDQIRVPPRVVHRRSHQPGTGLPLGHRKDRAEFKGFEPTCAVLEIERALIGGVDGEGWRTEAERSRVNEFHRASLGEREKSTASEAREAMEKGHTN